MTLNNFKLRHIDLLTGKHIEYMELLKDITGYKHTWFNKIFRYKKAFNKMYEFIEHYKRLDATKLVYVKGIPLKKPESIDEITFIAMMELNMLLNNKDNADRPIGELMGEVIAIVCYSKNIKHDFDIDSYSFEKFKKRVLNEPAYQMIGLYNWIDKSLKESSKIWTNLFFQVEVTDKDYAMAGGDSMKVFNVINSIRGICEDFNVTYKDAWQMQYSITQANNLSKQTSAYIQDKMAKIKEARMKAQQKKVG